MNGPLEAEEVKVSEEEKVATSEEMKDESEETKKTGPPDSNCSG